MTAVTNNHFAQAGRALGHVRMGGHAWGSGVGNASSGLESKGGMRGAAARAWTCTHEREFYSDDATAADDALLLLLLFTHHTSQYIYLLHT